MKKLSKIILIGTSSIMMFGCADNLGLSGDPQIETPSNLSQKVDSSYQDVVTNNQHAIFLSVYFARDKSALDANDNQLLNQIGDYLKQNPLSTVDVQGNASDTGTAKLNLKLSKARAVSVQQYLINYGVNSYQLTVEGFGMDKPFFSQDPSNRRVDLVFTSTLKPDGYQLYQNRLPYITKVVSTTTLAK